MKKWSHDTEINASIEQVWNLLNGSLEDMQKIMPNVIENKPIKVTDDGIGSIYRQKYQEGKRISEYDVETLIHMDKPDHKELKVGFTLGNMFEITALYELDRINEDETYFRYTTTNKPLKIFLKLFMLLASNKIVVQFVERVKNVAENQKNN
ncbi:SRPBCC family protein [Virgibacillus sp. C22-A2]|uniref:SRPBCC family protein n=1 Tax=Virgibacillus tibetensis TaxID=3042313 RepID=A0ABU6KH00_9BACI|nr:SRPBCC family protein [Virgibacillus sp. C22-A2]